MRLQGAVFSVEDTLAGREDADKLLSLLKMEGVWLYAVSARERDAAEALLRETGLSEYFRGLLVASEARCTLADARLYEKAMRRLQTGKRDTVAFVGRLGALRAAHDAGIRAAAVKGAADEAEWAEMRAEADEVVERYADFLA